MNLENAKLVISNCMEEYQECNYISPSRCNTLLHFYLHTNNRKNDLLEEKCHFLNQLFNILYPTDYT